MENMVSTVIGYSNHAFKNIFDVQLSYPFAAYNVQNEDKAKRLEYEATFKTSRYLCESAKFTDEHGFDIKFSEATQETYLTSPRKAKGITLVLRDYSDYRMYKALTAWVQNIYDYKNNYYLHNNPDGTIIIIMDVIPGIRETACKITLGGVIINKVSMPEFDWGDPSIQKITASFSFDTMDFFYPSAPSRTTGLAGVTN